KPGPNVLNPRNCRRHPTILESFKARTECSPPGEVASRVSAWAGQPIEPLTPRLHRHDCSLIAVTFIDLVRKAGSSFKSTGHSCRWSVPTGMRARCRSGWGRDIPVSVGNAKECRRCLSEPSLTSVNEIRSSNEQTDQKLLFFPAQMMSFLI